MLNQEIIELIGGAENIQSIAHCVTRLRFTLKNRKLAKTEAIKALDGVIDVVSNDVAYQIIVGTHVPEVYRDMMSLLGRSDENATDAQNKDFSLKGMFKSILVVLSETMSSIIVPLLMAGLLASVLTLLNMSGILPEESSTYQIFDTIRGATFHFLPILVAMSAAKRLQVNPYLAVVLAATLLSASIDGVEGLTLFGISLPSTYYANSFIPILLAVWFMGHVTRLANKAIPKALQYFFVPLVTMLITLPVTLFLFGPIGEWMSAGLGGIFTFLMDHVGNWIAVSLYAALQPFLILFGAGNFIMPISINFVATSGYDPIFFGAATISDIAVAGAMLGYFLRARSKKQKQEFGAVSFSAVMGITEPAVFGMFVKYRRPFLAVMIGGGLGGLIAGLAGVRTYGLVWGLFALPTYLTGGEVSNLIWMLISVGVSFLAATIASYLLGIPEEKSKGAHEVPTSEHSVTSNQISVGRIVSGERVLLSDIEDRAFASGAIGKGIGIIPTGAKATITSPLNGHVTVVFPTHHAYGITTDDGLEVLIHIGIDTVNLEGKHFESKVTQGQAIKQGDILAKFDAEAIKAEGFNPVVMAVVTNSNDYLDVLPVMDSDAQETLKVIT